MYRRRYWPLSPQRTVTIWLAVWDADEGNGAMRVVRGSHTWGALRHHVNDSSAYVLNQEADEDQIDPDQVVSMNLKAVRKCRAFFCDAILYNKEN